MLKQVTITADIPQGYDAVRYGFPQMGEKYLWNGAVATADTDFRNTSYLIVRPIPPVLVPLGPEDVVLGKMLVRSKDWHANIEACVLMKDRQAIYVLDCLPDPVRVHYQEMCNDGWLYSNDHGKTWQPCSKPAP